MDKNNLAEIRKALRKDHPPVDWVFSFYVTPENEIAWKSFRKYASLDQDEQFRHKDIFKKALSGAFGKELASVALPEQAPELFGLRTLEREDPELLDAFAGDVAASFDHTNPYYAMLARITYDVPAMAADRRKLEDGEVVFQSLLFAICPAQLSKPALGYSDTDGVAELSRRWTIGAPTEGFLYPAFADRIGDLNEVLYRAHKEISPGLFKTFFGDAEKPVTAKEQKEIFNSLMDAMDVTMESASLLQNDLANLAAEDVEVLEKETARGLAERCGIEMEHFDETYEEVVGDVPLSVTALLEKTVTIATDSATVRLPADRAQLVRTEMLGKVLCLVLPVDGAILVNGIPASLAKEITGIRAGLEPEKPETGAAKAPGPDQTTSGSEQTTPGPEQTTPGPDQTTSGPEQTTPGPEQTTSGPGAEKPEAEISEIKTAEPEKTTETETAKTVPEAPETTDPGAEPEMDPEDEADAGFSMVAETGPKPAIAADGQNTLDEEDFDEILLAGEVPF